MKRGPEESPQYVLTHLDPTRIRLQRERMGWKGKELAQKVGVTPSAISQIERGVTSPDLDTLMRLKMALSVPVSFFLRRSTNTRVQLDQCHFRSNRDVPQYERRRTTGDASVLIQLVEELSRMGVQYPDERISGYSDQITTVDQKTSLDHVERLATGLREYWGMGLGPIPNFVTLLESKGVLVLPIPKAHEKLDAFSFWSGNRPVIVLTQQKAASRDRTDVGHELGHLVMHGDAEPGLSAYEDQAFRFGAAFMAPRESFIKECPRRWSYPAFEDLKKRWKVSIATLVRRAYDLGCISKSAYTTANIELRKQLNEEGGEKAEWETERPVMIQQSLDLLSDKTSLNEMAHLVGVQTPDLYELLRPSVDEALLEELSNRKGQDEPDQIVTLKDEESKGVK